MEWMLDLPCPPTKKAQLEANLGVKLRNDLTMAQAIALGAGIGAIVDNEVRETIFERVEGAVKEMLELTGKNGAPLAPPKVITQYVSISKEDGKPVKVIDVESSNGNGTAALPTGSARGNGSNGSGT